MQDPGSISECMEQERRLMDGEEAWRSFWCWQVLGFRGLVAFCFEVREEVEDER